MSFLCSLLESVLMSAQVSFVTMREEDGDRNARLFMRFKHEPDRPLAAILSLNTIANTIGAAGVGYQTNKVFGNEWFGLVSALMTLLILVFSEIIPKTIGTSASSRLYREVTIRLLPQQAMTVTCIPVIEAEPGTEQTITVTIPKDLPRSIFPLQFKVEVAAKSLTPNAGDLPVEPGETIISGQSGGKYYYRATSKGTKTLNLKTSGSQTASVSVELIHGDFVPVSTAQTTRSYVTIAAQSVQFTGNRASGYYNNTVRCYSDSSYSTQVGSFTGTANWRLQYFNGEFTFTAAVDATQTIYMRYQDSTNNYTASATALDMYEGTSCAVTRTRR